MTGKPNGSGKGGFSNSYAERRNLERWSRSRPSSLPPRDAPLSDPELHKAAEVIERSIVAGSRDAKQAKGLVSAYRDTLKKLDRP